MSKTRIVHFNHLSMYHGDKGREEIQEVRVAVILINSWPTYKRLKKVRDYVTRKVQHLRRRDRHMFYHVTKKSPCNESTYLALWISLANLRAHLHQQREHSEDLTHEQWWAL
ncbi:hypothetical protein J6590_013868 [Homalodisca vitripennis]|nr:hypothetical protein J6590_013868 [Homalodisca vitripennis]